MNPSLPGLIPFAFPGVPGVGAVFSTRVGGSSARPFDQGNLSFDVGDDAARVLANRRAVARELGLSGWCEARQVHGETLVCAAEPGTITAAGCIQADGLATDRPGHGLVIKTADCQAILLAHKGGKHVCALHCGWRGVAARLPESGVRRFCEHYGLDPAELLAVRGPSLSPAASHFSDVERAFGRAAEPYYDAATQTVDMWRMTRDQLVDAGLLPGHVFGLDLCTASLPELFFSYRRRKVTGRQIGLVWIRP